MGYSTVAENDALLAQALTSAQPYATYDTKTRLISVGDSRDLNRIPTEIVEYYISLADSQIDGILSHLYTTPIIKCAHGEWALRYDLSEYNQIVEISTSVNLVPGDEIVLWDGTDEGETHIVSEVLDQYSFLLLDQPTRSFSADNTRVIRLSFPPPLNQISARFSCSFIYDKYFSAQSSPNVSDYGTELRKVAMQQLNDILNGKVILREPCTRRIGDRFGNAYLLDTYHTIDRGFNSSERNMSKL